MTDRLFAGVLELGIRGLRKKRSRTTDLEEQVRGEVSLAFDRRELVESTRRAASRADAMERRRIQLCR